MEHAFERYFETSGLFGTPDICLEQVRSSCKAIGVDEIACLIDFGVATDTVLASLPYLNEVRERSAAERGDAAATTRSRRRSNATASRTCRARRRWSARSSRTNAAATALRPYRDAAGRRRTAAAGAGERRAAADRRASCSTCTGRRRRPSGRPSRASPTAATSTIGRPIANTQIYIVDRRGRRGPGRRAGRAADRRRTASTRGYWQRPELTAERFVANRCSAAIRRATRRLLSHRRPGALSRRRPHRVPGPHRPSGQDPRTPHRARRNRDRARRPSVGGAVRRRRAARRQRRAAAGRLRRGPQRDAGRATARGDAADRRTRWQTVWDETYGGLAALAGQHPIAGRSTFSGWRNSYTGGRCRTPTCASGSTLTVGRILDAARRARVLEIGCGTGLLLHRLAPACDRYAGDRLLADGDRATCRTASPPAD